MDINIVTQRLTIRPFVESDLADYYAFVGDAQNAKAAGFQYAHSLEDARFLLRATMARGMIFAIVETWTKRVIGSVGFYPRMNANGEPDEDSADLGYVLNRSYWGKGYMTEAGSSLIQAVFNQQIFKTIWASHLQNNQRSKRVLEKLGFHYVDTFTHSDTALYQPGATEVIYRLDRK